MTSAVQNFLENIPGNTHLSMYQAMPQSLSCCRILQNWNIVKISCLKIKVLWYTICNELLEIVLVWTLHLWQDHKIWICSACCFCISYPIDMCNILYVDTCTLYNILYIDICVLCASDNITCRTYYLLVMAKNYA